MDSKYVFISYSKANKGIADASCHILEECGIPCWIAPRNITPGKTWAGNIVQAIRDCSLMVLIYSKESNSSSQVANEVDRAFSHGKIIIPFMVDTTPMNDDFDYYLSRKHWLVAYPDYKEMLMPLVEAVATNIGVEIKRPETTGPRGSTAPSPKGSTGDTAQNSPYQTALENARKALSNYELDLAFAELTAPALDDDRDAQFLMRTILCSYPRVQKLNAFRFKYFREKADTGNAFAQYVMSSYYSFKEQNPDKCFHYASLCAKQDKTYGFQALARCYELGIGVELDNAHSMELLDKAANMDDPFAMLRLAQDNLWGWSHKRNPKRAFLLLKRCMEMQLPESFALMGDMYENGNGVEQDIQRGLELYQKALDCTYLEAYEYMAKFHIFDSATLQYKDNAEIQKGISLLHKGIELGVASCLSTLAMCYYGGIGVEQKMDQAFRWYKKAAEMGDWDSFFMIGRMYYYGEGCTENNTEAWKWLVRGSELPRGSCYYQLGIMCQDGYGQEGKTQADCVQYYEKALYMGGWYAEESALRLYNIFRTHSLESNPLMRDDKDSCLNYDWAPKDNGKAVGYLKQAAGMDNKFVSIYFKYGAILCTEGNEFTDEFEGIRYLKLAAQKDEPLAAVMLAQIYEKGELVDKNPQQVQEYYQIAADKNCGDGYSGLAKMLCTQITDAADDADSALDKAAKQELISRAYNYVCKADELTCKGESPLEGSITAFMLTADLLTPAERDNLVAINEKYAQRGNLQSIVDSGVMHQMGLLAELDPSKAIKAYQLAARLGKECTAKNLGDLYSGKEPELPVEERNKPTAAYWYAKDSSEVSQSAYQALIQEGHQWLTGNEDSSRQPDSDKWIFPYLCDPIFTSASSKLRIFEWADFANGSFRDNPPSDTEPDFRYLPSNLKDIYSAYKDLRDQLVNTYGWDRTMLLTLNKEDLFPCISMQNLRTLTQIVHKAWDKHIIRGNDEWLRQQGNEIKKLSLMSMDWQEILNLIEKCPNTHLQQFMLNMIEICINLNETADAYWQLAALNGLVENTDNKEYRLPDRFVKECADQFLTGTQTLPRSHAIARRLYQQVIYLPGVDERLKRCEHVDE